MHDEYNNFMQDFNDQGRITVMNWLKVYNEADVIPFMEASDKTCKQYYPDEIDILKDVVSIPGILMIYVLNKSLKMKHTGQPPLFTPDQPGILNCTECEVDPKRGCDECKKVHNDCTQCMKNKPYELLKTGMIGGLRYH